MKKILWASVLALCLIISVTSASLAATTAQRLNRTIAASSSEISSLETKLKALESSRECFAVLREKDGIIGLYDSNGKILICTIDTPIISLPEKERGEIMVGMEIKDAFHFMELFESLTE